MKTATIPSIRVSADLRRQAESVLGDGETLSDLVRDLLTRGVECRAAQHKFIARGLESAVQAKVSGEYVSAHQVIHKLARRLAKARKHAAR